MKPLSVKNLKKTSRTLYHFKGSENFISDTSTTTGGTDPTNTLLTILTQTGIANQQR